MGRASVRETPKPRLATDPADERRCERQGHHMDIVLITDDTSRAELEEAITNLAATARRLPQHYADRKAALHARIDALLTEWELAQ